MKINSLILKDFRGLDEVWLNQLDPKVNLFVGANGAGKSSILDAVSILMSWMTAIMVNPRHGKGSPIPLNDISIGSQTGCILSIATDCMGYWKLYRTRRSTPSDRSDLSVLRKCVWNQHKMLELDGSFSLPLFVHYKVGRNVSDAPVRLRCSSKSDNMLQLWSNPLGTASFREFFYWYREQEDIENEKIRSNPDFRNRNLEAIRRVFAYCFPGYGEMQVRRSPASMVVEKDGNKLRIEQLSDGEKCYIALMCDICRRLAIANPEGDILEGKGVVLIDEIDLHLHPEWQLEVVNKLTSIFPNLQFLVTSHSPLVASDIKGKVFIVKNKNVFETSEATFGKNSSQLLGSLFGVYSQRSPRMQELIDKAYCCLREYDFDSFIEYFDEISDSLGNDDNQVLDLKIEEIRRKKLSGK